MTIIKFYKDSVVFQKKKKKNANDNSVTYKWLFGVLPCGIDSVPPTVAAMNMHNRYAAIRIRNRKLADESHRILNISERTNKT